MHTRKQATDVHTYTSEQPGRIGTRLLQALMFVHGQNCQHNVVCSASTMNVWHNNMKSVGACTKAEREALVRYLSIDEESGREFIQAFIVLGGNLATRCRSYSVGATRRCDYTRISGQRRS